MLKKKVEASVARRPSLFLSKNRRRPPASKKKVEASVARRLRAPPYAAKRKDFGFGTGTA